MALSKNSAKHIRSLAQKKFRQQHQQFVAEGDKIVRELLSTSAVKIVIVVCTSDWYTKNTELVAQRKAEVVEVTPTALNKISQLKTANQVLAVVVQWQSELNAATVSSDWSLYLERVQDPGNLGTILRIADWFGIPNVICSPDCADLFNSKVIQSSMGAFMRIAAPRLELAQLHQQFPDIPIYASSLSGTSIYEQKQLKPGILVMGNESRGITEEAQTLATAELKIPSYGKHDMESLNVAVATGILCAALRFK
ncbi:MAG: RNA methyltransferase [Bacteroidota bacterium]